MNSVKDWLTRVWDKMKALWSKASKKVRILFAAALAGVVVLLALAVAWITHTEYVLLASGLSAQENAAVLSVLGQIGVEPQITNTGAILVPEQDLNRSRMQIAQRTTGSFGYELYQSLGITATQADKNQVEIYQKQENLRAMIETNEEIDRAMVQLSIPQPSIYALQGNNLPPTASVKLVKRPGYSLTPEQVQGIVNLVKYSVSGLTEENIAISDETGDLKAQMMTGAPTNKLLLTEQINSSVKSRLLQGLQSIYGQDNVQVAVNTALDTDAKVIKETTYLPLDPADPRNNPLDLHEREREKIGAAEGAAQGVPGANDNVDVPQYSAEDLDVTDGDSWRANDIYDYLVSSVVSDIIKEGLEITDMSVGVLINSDSVPGGQFTDNDRDKVVDFISGATGLTVDKIKVQSMRFQPPAAIGPDDGAQLRRILLLTGLALLALCVIFILIFLYVQKRHKQRLEAERAAAGVAGDMSLADLMGSGENIEYEPIQLVETQEQKLKLQIRDLANSDPQIVAQLIKTWLVNS